MNDGNRLYYPQLGPGRHPTGLSGQSGAIDRSGSRDRRSDHPLTPPPFDPISKPQKNLLPPGQAVYGYGQTYSLYDDTLVALGAFKRSLWP